VRIRDDELPAPPNIESVEIVYRTTVDGVTGEFMREPMTFDDSLGDGGIMTNADDGRPLDRFSDWTGSIPGQGAGTRVEFYFEARDAEGGIATAPNALCFNVLTDPKVNLCDVEVDDAEGIGPCDEEFGGPRCLEAPCEADKYIPCDVPYSYFSGYTPPAPQQES